MSDTDVHGRSTRLPAVIALLLAVAGTAGMAWSFPMGISAALDSGGAGATPYVVIFLIAGVLVLAALAISIVCLVRGIARPIAAIALAISLVPIVGVIILRIAAVS
jgi:hypothetical protein